MFYAFFFRSLWEEDAAEADKEAVQVPEIEFIEEHLLNLIKIVMCGEVMLFSYFFQSKVA